MPIQIDPKAILPLVKDLLLPMITFIVGLYFDHLRGSKLEVIAHRRPSGLHHCAGLDTGQWPGNARVKANLTIVNTGRRPGTLCYFRADPMDDAITEYTYDPLPEQVIPVTLQPGDDWKMSLWVTIRPRGSSWEEYLASTEAVPMKIVYTATESFGRRPTKSEPLKIELEPLRASIEARASEGREV